MTVRGCFNPPFWLRRDSLDRHLVDSIPSVGSPRSPRPRSARGSDAPGLGPTERVSQPTPIRPCGAGRPSDGSSSSARGGSRSRRAPVVLRCGFSLWAGIVLSSVALLSCAGGGPPPVDSRSIDRTADLTGSQRRNEPLSPVEADGAAPPPAPQPRDNEPEDHASPSRPSGDPAPVVAPPPEEAPPEAPPPTVSVPATLAEARALWEEHRVSSVPILATFFQLVEFAPEELGSAFILLREVLRAVPSEHEAAADASSAILGLLRIPPGRLIRLEGVDEPVRWSLLLRWVVGLRASDELGPLLLAALERRWPADAERADGNGDMTSPLVRGLVYALAYLDFEPALPHVLRYAGALAGRGDDLLVLEILSFIRDARGRRAAERILETTGEVRVVAAASRTLVLLVGEEAESSLAPVLRDENEKIRRAVVGPLLEVCTPTALARVIQLKDSAREEWTGRMIQSYLRRYGRELDLSAAELEELIRSDSAEAADRMRPFAQRLDFLAEDDRTLTAEDLLAVLDNWAEKRTIYTDAWSWVRDRHIVAVAGRDQLGRIERVRRAILDQTELASVAEAGVIQRIYASVAKRLRER